MNNNNMEDRIDLDHKRLLGIIIIYHQIIIIIQ